MMLRSLVTLTVGVLGLFAWAIPPLARADIMIVSGNHPQPGEENVLLKNGTTGNPVFGTSNTSGLTVQFDSSTNTLTEPSNGQARVEAVGATGGQVAMEDIAVSLPGGTFKDLIFNPHIGGQIGSGGSATITVNALDSMGNPEAPVTATFTFGNGENFITVTASNGESITSVDISNGGGFTDLRQVRISGATIGSVPEPATLAILACGGLGLLGYRRCRQKV